MMGFDQSAYKHGVWSLSKHTLLEIGYISAHTLLLPL